SVPALIDALAAIADLLTTERIVTTLRGAFAIAEEDLGITGERLGAVAVGILERVEERLTQPLESGDASATALHLYDIGSCIGRLRFVAMPKPGMPRLDLEILVAEIERRWELTGINQIAQLLKGFFEASGDIAEALAAIVQMLTLNVEVDVDTTTRSLGGGSEADIRARQGEASRSVAWYATWVANETVKYNSAQPADRFTSEHLRGMDYVKFDAETMEQVARISAIVAPALEAFLHFSSMEQGDLASNTAGAAINLTDMIVNIAEERLHPVFHWLVFPVLVQLPAGIENERSDPLGDPPYVATNMLGDFGEFVLYRRWIWLARELLLSVLTLLNNRPGSMDEFANQQATLGQDEITRARHLHNNNCFEGVCYSFAELASMIVPLIHSHTDRKDYGMIGGTLPSGAIEKGIYAALIEIGSLYLAVPLASLMAGEWPSDWARFGKLLLHERIFGKFEYSGEAGIVALKVLASLRGAAPLLLHFVDYFVYLYLFTNGSTDDGKFCLDTGFTERRFAGYSAQESSPYLLPYPSGETKQCVQTNMGIWSHYPQNVAQTYAYDFSHDMGDEVSCSRAGIITALTDTIPDGNAAGAWNFIEVMHIIAGSEGFDPVPPPAGVTTFNDGTPTQPATPIPAGTLFPPYWANPAAGNPGLTNGYVPPLHPTATAAAWPAGSKFRFIDPAVDRAIVGVTFSSAVLFSDGTPIPPGAVFAPDTTAPPAPGSDFPAGTTFIPNPGGTAAVPAFLPLRATFAEYGHGQQNFMTAVHGTSIPNLVLGRFVQQGQIVMLSDDTGISVYNHLHVHVNGASGFTWTIPFVYRDVTHSVVPHGLWKGIFFGSGKAHSMTQYTSTNVKP
ncbi:MAG: hypothetical protein ACRDKZ_15265, partial [Actinomycetota bacterium]